MLTPGAVFGRSDESFVGQSRGIVYYAGKHLERVINAKVWFSELEELVHSIRDLF